MKFGIHLSTNLTPEWNSQYIQYEYMKELLEKAVAVAPIISYNEDNLLREQYFVRADEDFFEVRIVIMFHSISIDFF
jgi:SPX domain protein involved in polyphosphate accumulation